MSGAALRPFPQAGTHNHVMLAQHGHLPEGLVGESVEVVGTVLPPAPALLPASVHQLLCKQAWNPAGVRAASGATFLPRHPATAPRQYLGGPAPGGWALESRAGSDWRCPGSDSARTLPPGGCRDSHWPSQHPHRTCHTEDQRVSGPAGYGGQLHPPTYQLQPQGPRDHLQVCRNQSSCLEDQHGATGALGSCSSLTIKRVHSCCSFCLKYSFPKSLPGLPLGSLFQEALLD